MLRTFTIGAILAILTGCVTATYEGGKGFAPMPPGTASNLRGLAAGNALLTRQAEGEIAAPLPPTILRAELQHAHYRRGAQHSAQVDPSRIGMWGSNYIDSYIYAMNKQGNQILSTVDVAANGCFNPVTIKVDHKRNIWVSCEELDVIYPHEFGGVQEYGSDGSVKRSYAFDASRFCASDSEYCLAESLDGGWDGNGHIFAELSSGDAVINRTAHYLDPGFYWWNATDRSGPGKFIRASSYCTPFCAIDFMDVDSSGNIWFDFSTSPSGHEGYAGLGEVTSPTKKPVVKVILPAGTYAYPGGVYVSGHGTVLNVTDQSSRETYQYHLPVTSTSTPFNVLGPTATKYSGEGRPVSGGFNKSETALALADLRWIDIGRLPANTWSLSAEADCADSNCLGIAYTPSDK